MTRITDSEALANLERRMTATFGVDHIEYDAGTAMSPVPLAYLTTAIRLTEASGIVAMASQWQAEARKSNAGKKSIIPLRAIVALYLLNMQMGQGVTYSELARTLAYRFKTEHFAMLGIRFVPGDVQVWYHRVSDASYRLIKLMNPRDTALRKVLDEQGFADLLARMAAPSAVKLAERNQNRLDQFCNLLVEASLRLLPEEIWKRYRGNIAIDATKAHIRGPKNSSGKTGSRSNPDPLAGRYRREGNHDGQGAKTDVAAYELETAVMIWNKPGENCAFPSLVTAISCHNPGEITGHAAELMRRQKDLGFNRFKVVVDRAYNGEAVEDFHVPATKLGLDLVFDYTKTALGLQSNFEDLILVDGSWYVNSMPEKLIAVTQEFRAAETRMEAARSVLYLAEHKIPKKGATPIQLNAQKQAEVHAKEVLAEFQETMPTLEYRLAQRDPYRMIPKGLRDQDGYQRFSYPPPGKMLVKHVSRNGVSTITVPPTLPISEEVASGEQSTRKTREQRSKNDRPKMQPIKFTQLFPYKSPGWKAHFGMRSLVESSNNLLKSATHGDIENPRKRSGRGYAATYLALTFAVVASNLRRIYSHFIAEAEGLQANKATERVRRRKDEMGRPLAKPGPKGPPEGS